MKILAYQELSAAALDLFKEELANHPEIIGPLAAGSDLDGEDEDDLWMAAYDIAEDQTKIAVPDDYPDEKLMTLLREDFSLFGATGPGEHDSVRAVLINVVRNRILGDILNESGIRYDEGAEAVIAPKL